MGRGRTPAVKLPSLVGFVTSLTVEPGEERQHGLRSCQSARALNTLWLELLDNKVSPRRGLMVSLLQA